MCACVLDGLTLARGFESERLKTPSECGGVDDIHAVLTLAPSVQCYSHNQHDHRHYTSSQAGVEGHVTVALHTFDVLKAEACFRLNLLLFPAA